MVTDVDSAGDDERPLVRRLSRHDLAETVRRIEHAAALHGLPVFARIDPDALAAEGPRQAPPARVIVLEAGAGGTPVLLDEDAASRPRVPLSLVVRSLRGGAAEVSFDSLSERCRDALPHEIATAMARLPQVVALALRD
jgi:uncharacterized protein (DUF302 family)